MKHISTTKLQLACVLKVQVYITIHLGEQAHTHNNITKLLKALSS